MANDRSRKRIETLFAQMEQLSTEPSGEKRQVVPAATSTPLHSEMEALRSRIRALEIQIKDSEARKTAAPLLYEKEEVGFAYAGEEITPVRMDQPRVGDEAGVVKTPLTSSGVEIGEVQVSPAPERPLTEEDVKLASAVAQQASLQIENLRLLAAAERARAEAEDATRRLTRQNWDAFAEKENAATGFMYDSVKVSPLNGNALTVVDFEHPLMVRGEPIGQLVVAGMPRVSQEAMDIAAAIAKQTSIHLETLRLTEELQKRAEELKELDRLKSAFLANMSHELRTPMNSILGFTDVMLEGLDGPLTENMDNDLRLIQKNGQHLLHLINDVLDMAKIESGKMNLNLEKFRVHAAFEDVISITSTFANDKHIALSIAETSDQTVEIYADNTRLRQVLINLVNNAIKFTEAGKVTIAATPMKGAKVLISVKDTGIGIPQNDLEAVFQEFTQVDVSTTRKAGGTGLGLPISRRLVEMHGGRLWAESAGIHGEGSTFFVEMPLEARVTEVVEKREQ